jgi:metallophosphoesterase (TIGR03767 family)
MVAAGSGGPEFEGVQGRTWPDDVAWKPDGSVNGPDRFRIDRGFPHLPGLLERATRPFQARGLAMPWIGGYGNHEEVCQGVGMVTPTLATAMVGSHKPIAPPDGLDPATAVALFATAPERFMDARGISVTPDPNRRPAQLAAFLDAHMQSKSLPLGHGFGATNRLQGQASYVHDTPPARLISIDTVSRDAGADGRITAPQLEWLEERLIEVHSSYTDRAGRTTRTSNVDRLVVLLSHHPYMSLNNPRARDAVQARELLRVLHRFANVVLWLNGHVHMNVVQKRPNREGVSAGFWEATTSSLVDWPCQSRVVEILDAGHGRLAIACTMVDHEGLVDPGEAETHDEIAGLHRQLAANDPLSGAASPRAGQPADRNVILALPAPFPLKQLHSA